MQNLKMRSSDNHLKWRNLNCEAFLLIIVNSPGERQFGRSDDVTILLFRSKIAKNKPKENMALRKA